MALSKIQQHEQKKSFALLCTTHFAKACQNGHVEMMQWFWLQYDSLQISKKVVLTIAITHSALRLQRSAIRFNENPELPPQWTWTIEKCITYGFTAKDLLTTALNHTIATSRLFSVLWDMCIINNCDPMVILMETQFDFFSRLFQSMSLHQIEYVWKTFFVGKVDLVMVLSANDFSAWDYAWEANNIENINWLWQQYIVNNIDRKAVIFSRNCSAFYTICSTEIGKQPCLWFIDKCKEENIPLHHILRNQDGLAIKMAFQLSETHGLLVCESIFDKADFETYHVLYTMLKNIPNQSRYMQDWLKQKNNLLQQPSYSSTLFGERNSINRAIHNDTHLPLTPYNAKGMY